MREHRVILAALRARDVEAAVRASNEHDRRSAAEIVMTDFRSAILGRITLETPAEFEAWRAAGLAEDAKRQAKKDARAEAKDKGSGVREPAPDSDVD